MSSKKDIDDLIKENKSVNDEYEQRVSAKGLYLGATAAIFLSIIMMVIEFISTKTIDFGKPCLIAAICSLSSIIFGFKNGRVKEIIFGIICTLCGLICFYFYLSKNLGIL